MACVNFIMQYVQGALRILGERWAAFEESIEIV